MEYRSIYMTAGDEIEAKLIARTLVQDRLVACVNFFPIQSVYCWKGKIDETGEYALIAKTRADLVDRIIDRVKQLHSYETPCVVAWSIQSGNPDYLEWIKESTI